MAGSDSQKQFLSLIRDFASQKSHGDAERRVVGLKKRIKELELELDTANKEREEAKRAKENTEQELKGYEVQLSMNEASIQALEGRISNIQDEITTVGSHLDALKNEETITRDKFINRMFEINARIRKFQGQVAGEFIKDSVNENASGRVSRRKSTEITFKSLEDELARIIAQTTKEEEEYLAEESNQKQLQQEYLDLGKKVSLMQLVLKETKELQEITRQTSELEKMCASLSMELQKRCICPKCQLDNVEFLAGMLQANEAV